MLRMTVYAILLIVITSKVQAFTEARLLNQSTSGQTVVFNLGSHDGIGQGDYAVIVKQIRSLDSRDLRLIPAAKARNVKINSDSSVWILYKIYDQELFVKGEKFVVLSESFMLSGRRPPTLGRVAVVSPKKDLKANALRAENNDRDRLGKLKNKYETMEVTHETTYASDNDVDLIDLEAWDSNKETRHRTSLYRSAEKAEFRRQLRLASFEKLVTGYLRRVNDPNFNYDSFYERQKKAENMQELNVHGTSDSEYHRFLRQQARSSNADAKLFRSILEKGDSWSEEYSDEELRDTLMNVSELQEKDRQHMVLSKPTRFAMALDYGFSLSDSQTDKDPLYQRKNRYSAELDFEVTPFLKHESLERLTLTSSVRSNHTAFESENFNSDLDEYSVSLGANWYPLYAPYTTAAPVIFAGTFVRSGFGKASSPSANEKANYTVMSIPGFRFGLKYLLRNRIGIRLLMSMETLKIERYEASKTNSVLPERANLVETKMGVGLAYSF